MLSKKLVLFCAFFSLANLMGMEQVTIQTEEGQEFIVDADLAKLSETLKNLIEDAGGDLLENSLPLPNITGATWAQIQNLLPAVRDIIDGTQDAQQKKDGIIAALKQLDGTNLIAFIIAVNYLDIRILLELAIDVAKQIDVKKITPAQIAALPKEIRNPIIFAQTLNILGPLSDSSLQVKQTAGKRSVFSVDVSPDGSKMVSGSNDRTVRIWDVNNFNLLKTFYTVNMVRAVCVTPDGRKLVTGSDDGVVRLLDINTGGLHRVFMGHIFPVTSISITPDGNHIVSGSADGTIRIWDIMTGELVAVLRDSVSKAINAVFVTPNGKHIISGSDDYSVGIWDIGTYKPLVKLIGHTGPVKGVWATPDGAFIVSGSLDGTVRIWDSNTHQQLYELKADGPVNSVVVTQDGSKILSSSQNGIQVWDRNNRALLVHFIVFPHMIRVTPDGKTIVGSSGNLLFKFDMSILDRFPAITLQQAEFIWSYLQGSHREDWSPILNLLALRPTMLQGVAGVQEVQPPTKRRRGAQ
ncbi:MAG: hypothetical protein AB7F19_04605 [Candidatus Babeliales bacterium]